MWGHSRNGNYEGLPEIIQSKCSMHKVTFNPLYTGNPLKGTLINSEDPDEMPHIAAFHLGLHCLFRKKQSSGTQIHNNWRMTTCNPLKDIMDNPIYMGKSIRIQWVKDLNIFTLKVVPLIHWFMTLPGKIKDLS